jgi:hypothetical protein
MGIARLRAEGFRSADRRLSAAGMHVPLPAHVPSEDPETHGLIIQINPSPQNCFAMAAHIYPY